MISDSEALQERKLHSHVLMQGFTSFYRYGSVVLGHGS